MEDHRSPVAGGDAVDEHRTFMDKIDFEQCDFESASVDGMLSMTNHCSRSNPNFSLTIYPASPSNHNICLNGSARRLLEEYFAGSSIEDATSSMDFGDTNQTSSIDVDGAIGILSGGASLANVSTMIDENSIWDQMWSVIGGAPSDSTQDNDLAINFEQPSVSWLHEPSRGTKLFNQSGVLPQPTAPAGPRKSHRARKSREGREADAKRFLREATPLHVHSINRFLRRPKC
jgi:hypothetical protein